MIPGGQGPDLPKSTRSYTWGGLRENYTYSGFVWGRNAAGFTGSDQRSVTTPYCYPVSADIKANGSDGPITINYNTSATISWSSTNATSCSVSPTGWTGLSNGGISTGNLTSSRTYTLTCTRSGQTKTDSVTVNVLPKPTVSISASPTSIKSGEASTISWSSANASSVTITPDIGTVGTSGSRQVRPTSSVTYQAQANAPGGTSDPAFASVTVDNKLPKPSVSISANPSSISGGQTVTLSWSSTNATSVTITPGVGTVGASGSRQVKPVSSTVYKAVATGPGGTSDPAYASVTVDGKPPGLLNTLQLTVSVPHLVGNMKVPVKMGSLSKEIEISPDKKGYSLDIKEANIAIGSSVTLTVGGKNALIKKVSSKVEAEVLTVEVGDLILGDITGDNKINDKDVVSFLDSLTNQTPKGDLNADKVTNSLDWAILLANFGKSGDF